MLGEDSGVQTMIEYPEIAANVGAKPRATVLETGRAVEVPELPQDAREWVDPCTLSLWVQDEVDALTSDRLGMAGGNIDPEAVRMFELLAFAYATNVLASYEIAAQCKSDPAFRFLSSGQTPFPEEITAFRRRHRGQLESLLTRVFAWVMSTRIGDVRPSLYLDLLQIARDRLDVARHLDEL